MKETEVKVLVSWEIFRVKSGLSNVKEKKWFFAKWIN